MTLKQFIENLNEFVKENPETLDMNVITSEDDEGNGFSPVYFTPSKGFYNDSAGFIYYEAYEAYKIDNSDTNAVCIN
jgi:sucrose-6-phosphate hydrolase SacC (GH32 family)